MSFIRILAIVLGALVFLGSGFYLIKERKDAESVKIYAVATAIGVVVAVLGVAGVIA